VRPALLLDDASPMTSVSWRTPRTGLRGRSPCQGHGRKSKEFRERGGEICRCKGVCGFSGKRLAVRVISNPQPSCRDYLLTPRLNPPR
jgi:hypothetical protein